MMAAEVAWGAIQDAVARVAARIEITDVRLRYATAVMGAASATDLPSEWVTQVSTQYEGNAMLGDVDAEALVAEEVSKFVSSVSFRIEYWAPDRRPPSEEDLPDIGLFAAFELSYDLESSEGLRYADLQEFASVNSVFNAWPYWRELVDSTTRRMGLTTPLVVGVLTASGLVTTD